MGGSERSASKSSLRRLKAALLATPLVATSVGTTALEAAAYPVGPVVGACGSPLRYRFASSIQHQNMAVAGFMEWESVRDRAGNSYVDVNQVTSGADIDVYAEPMGVGGSSGDSSCENGRIRFNADDSFSSTEMRALAAHEMGHVLGLGHTGANDNSANTTIVSRMATNYSWASRQFSSDDRAALTSKRGGRELSNGSFETSDDWKAANGTLSRPIGGAFIGSRYASFVPNDSTGYLTQSQCMYYGTAAEHAVSLRARRPSGGTGEISAQMWSRSYNYETDFTPDARWPSNGGWLSINGNIRQNLATNFTLLAYTNQSVGTGWSLVGVSAPVLRGSPNGENATDIQVRIYSSVKNGSGYVPLHIDDVQYNA